jgi:hypothetical protein
MDKKSLQVHAVTKDPEFVNLEQQGVTAFRPQQRQQTGQQQSFTIGATIVPEDKVTDQISTATTVKTPTSQNPMHREMVNSVSIAKS